jgi:hypothetical protein
VRRASDRRWREPGAWVTLPARAGEPRSLHLRRHSPAPSASTRADTRAPNDRVARAPCGRREPAWTRRNNRANRKVVVRERTRGSPAAVILPDGAHGTPDAVVLPVTSHYGMAHAVVQRRSGRRRMARSVEHGPSSDANVATETVRGRSCARRTAPTSVRRPSRDRRITSAIRHPSSRNPRFPSEGCYRHPARRGRVRHDCTSGPRHAG